MHFVSFRPLALQDIRETFAYLKEHAGPTIAERYIDSVRSTANSLISFPAMGSSCHYAQPELKDLRRWPVKSFERWQIFYFPNKQKIVVARVLHTARNLDDIFG